ncbi:AAA family ATPase [Polynucleobacter paneuropaeus]|nr:AAA family ATPase [Polynucleobacter paneuropaeus]
MNGNLIQGQHLVDSFVNLLGTPSPIKVATNLTSGTVGRIDLGAIPLDLQNKLSQLFTPTPVADDQYRALFYGDITRYGGDNSAADLALIGYFSRQGLSASEADQVFRASKLFRDKWDQMRGDKTYGQRTIQRVYEVQKEKLQNQQAKDDAVALLGFKFNDPSTYKPIYLELGMPAREFVGPKICPNTTLFPTGALSSLVALGGVGKTSTLLAIASHIASGKSWNGYPLKKNKVAIFFCEENQDEINRKFGAIVDSWSPQERKEAIGNLLAIPMLGTDGRLTTINKGQYYGTGIAEEIIELLSKFGLKDGLVIFDHMQGFTSGDQNLSETATAICREANKVVDATGAAVVLAAHISKANINSTSLEQGFAVGSLAFENATRQMSGMLPMSEEIAKKYGLQELRKEYVWLGLAKNNYGDPTEGLWLHKVKSKKFHTVVFEPVSLHEPVSASRMTANEKLSARIVNYIRNHPFTTKNILDGLSGTEEEFQASKRRVREAVKSLIDSGEIEIHTVTNEERIANNVSKQVTKVLRADSVKTVSKDGRQ